MYQYKQIYVPSDFNHLAPNEFPVRYEVTHDSRLYLRTKLKISTFETVVKDLFYSHNHLIQTIKPCLIEAFEAYESHSKGKMKSVDLLWDRLVEGLKKAVETKKGTPIVMAMGIDEYLNQLKSRLKEEINKLDSVNVDATKTLTSASRWKKASRATGMLLRHALVVPAMYDLKNKQYKRRWKSILKGISVEEYRIVKRNQRRLKEESDDFEGLGLLLKKIETACAKGRAFPGGADVAYLLPKKGVPFLWAVTFDCPDEDLLPLIPSLTKENLEQTDLHSNSSIHLAVARNRQAVVRQLLKCKDMDVNQKNHLGWRPIHVAVEGQSLAMVEQLLTVKNIDLNGEDVHKRPPLCLAIRAYFQAEEDKKEIAQTIIKRLVLAGAKVSKQNLNALPDPDLKTQIKTWMDERALWHKQHTGLLAMQYQSIPGPSNTELSHPSHLNNARNQNNRTL